MLEESSQGERGGGRKESGRFVESRRKRKQKSDLKEAGGSRTGSEKENKGIKRVGGA